MTNKRWFTMKHHGWGWVPITWEGWAATLGIIGYIFYVAIPLGKETPLTFENFWFKFIIAIGIFIVILFKKGPMPRWRWDNK